jgi:hypothetical protein
LRPDRICQIYLVKKRGSRPDGQQVDYKTSSCPKLSKFAYKSATEHHPKSPCTNVPVHCPLCPDRAAAVWKYNLHAHIQTCHAGADLDNYRSQWEVTNMEREGMALVRHRIQNPRKRKAKSSKNSIKISESHSSRLALRCAYWNSCGSNAFAY